MRLIYLISIFACEHYRTLGPLSASSLIQILISMQCKLIHLSQKLLHVTTLHQQDIFVNDEVDQHGNVVAQNIVALSKQAHNHIKAQVHLLEFSMEG